jgi:predicted tellurium resistance membrane protein TerC
VGAALLLWIGVGLLQGEDDEEGIEGHAGLAAAIKTIVLADLVMSLDNVVGVAAAAKGNVPLLVFGLVISIPLIIFGSAVILKLMDRFPIIITFGAALLGWVAGEMAITDPAIAGWATERHTLHTVVPALGAMFVVAIGKWLSTRSAQRREQQLQAAKKEAAV